MRLQKNWIVGLIVCAFFWGVGRQVVSGEESNARSNPYTGLQERENVFEFTEKPRVEKDGDTWKIRFAVKSACDATVAVVGPDGKILRRLASGVLGKNAPWPFQQNSLTQVLVWDGKDDDGKAAPPGCSVKVGLGLDAKFEKLETWALLAGLKPLAVGQDGDLYAVSSTDIIGSIQVFDKTGKYLRTIFPPLSVLSDGKPISPEQFAPIQWNKTSAGDWVPRRNRFGGGYDFSQTKHGGFYGRIVAATATNNGKLCLLYAGANSLIFIMDVRDGSCPPGGVVDIGKTAADGMAASPDGKWLYLAGRAQNQWDKGRPFSHAIMRLSLENPGKPEVFVGDPAKAGADNTSFNGPNRVACDKDGNVFVNDQGNNRIVVFKPDGTHLKTLAGMTGLCGVSHKTGAVFLWYQKSWQQSPVLTKLASLDNPTKIAELEIRGPWEGGQWREGKQAAILSLMSEPSLLWFAGEAYRGHPFVRAYEDKGDKLESVVDLLKVNELPSFPGADVTSPGMWSSLHVNRKENTLGFDPVDAQGNIYRRSMFWTNPPAGMADNKMWVLRYDPKSKTYFSFEHGEPAGAPNGFMAPYAPLLQDGKPVQGLPMYYARGSHHHQGPFCVAPNGDVYVGATYAKQADEELEKAGLPRLQPNRLRPICVPVLRVYGPDGKLKSPCALPGLAELEGLRVGRSGAIYVVQPWKSLDRKNPDGLDAGATYDDTRWGSLIKFPGNFEKFPVGRIEGAWEPSPADATHQGSGMKVKIHGALWTYDGVSPHSAHYSSCTCMKAGADLDDYERSFVCAAQTCSVNVIDSNGNVMARLGGFGNVDELLAGKKLYFSLPRNVAASDDVMWVVDLDYRALIKTALFYRVEETARLGD